MKLSAIETFEMVREGVRKGWQMEINATGSSMLPFIRPNDIVTIVARHQYHRGDIVMARVDGPHEVVLHAIVAHDGDRYRLMGTANLQLTESCSSGDIAGMAVCVERNGKITDFANRRHHLAMALWLRMLPLRRGLMYIYRKTHRI